MRKAMTMLTITGSAAMAGPVRDQPPGQILAGLVGLLLVAVLFFVGLLALAALYALLRPRQVREGAEQVRLHPTRNLALGVILGLLVVLALNVTEHLPKPLGGPLGLLLLAAVAWWLVAGLTMLAHELGERVQANLGLASAGVGLKAVFWGLLLMALLGLVPFVGWVVQFFLVLLALGTAVAHRFLKTPAPAAAGDAT